MNTTKQIIENKRANSFAFRYAGVGTEVKIYFDDAEDLEVQLHKLQLRKAVIKNELDLIKENFKEVK